MKNRVCLTRIVVALLALVVSSGAFASSDYLLELEGIKGECKGKHIKLTEQADGSWTAENIPSGTYKLIAKPAKSAVVPNVSVSGNTSRNKYAPQQFNFECILLGSNDAARSSDSPRPSVKHGRRQQNLMAIQKLASLTEEGTELGDIVVVKNNDDTSKTKEPGGPQTGYDIKIAKKI